MTLINCRCCGKLTLDALDGYCQECAVTREMQMSRIKDFIIANPTAGINDITEQTDISCRLILDFIKEGRLGSIAH